MCLTKCEKGKLNCYSLRIMQTSHDLFLCFAICSFYENRVDFFFHSSPSSVFAVFFAHESRLWCERKIDEIMQCEKLKSNFFSIYAWSRHTDIWGWVNQLNLSGVKVRREVIFQMKYWAGKTFSYKYFITIRL